MAERPRGSRVVAVLGFSSRRDDGIHPICATRVAHAAALAADADTVILSGWARRSRAKPEAELMRAAWAGPDVPLVCDPDARTTAENAANVAATASALGADELVVVTSRWHRPRARILLQAALGNTPVKLSLESPPGPRPPTVLAREAVCVVLLPLQLRQARRRSAGRH